MQMNTLKTISVLHQKVLHFSVCRYLQLIWSEMENDWRTHSLFTAEIISFCSSSTARFLNTTYILVGGSETITHSCYLLG